MSGRARLAVFAAAATVMAACSLLPLATPAGWLLQAAFLVAVQSSVGALARRVSLARPLTVLAQAIVSLLALTLMFAAGRAWAGFLPGPRVFIHLGDLLRDGVRDVGQFAIPAPVTPGIRLLLVGGVLLIGLAVDAVAVTYGSAAAAGLPLLALYSVAAGLSGGGSRWLWFLIAATGYLLLLLAEGRDRLSRWGRVFGAASPPSGWAGGTSALVGGPAVAPVRTGRRIGAMALGIALFAPAVLPSLGTGLLDAAGRTPGTGHGGGTLTAVNPVVALQDSLNQPDNREVLTYRTNAGRPQDIYLRIVALDQFDGTQWQPSKRTLRNVPEVLPYPPGLAADVKVSELVTSVSADDDYVQSWMPLPYPAEKVRISAGRWRFEPEGRTIIGDRGQTTSGVRYTVTSLQVQPTAAQLAAAPEPPARIADEYTKVPDSLPDVVGRTAVEITKGTSTAYQKAVALQRYFTSGRFTYSTNVSSGSGVEAITRFLRDKEGFCVHFAFTMAAMARTLHIPARVAVGWTPGTAQPDGSVAVGVKDAHAWPELYFEGVGWTRFEPTPFRGTAPDYTQDLPSVPGGDRSDLPARGSTATPRPGPSASATCSPKDHAVGDCRAAGPVTSGGPEDGGGGGGELIVLVLAAVVALLLPALPMVWRRRERARRLGDGPSPGGRFAGGRVGGGRVGGGRIGGRALQDGVARGDLGQADAGRDRPDGHGGDGHGGKEHGGEGHGLAAERPLAAWRELIDTAWDYGILPDESETPRRAVVRLVREGRLDDAAARAAGQVATAVEQVLYAPRPRPAPGLAEDVRRVREGLHRAAGRRARVRAVVMPRSAVRVVWQLSEHWSLVTNRWSGGTRRIVAGLRRIARQPS